MELSHEDYQLLLLLQNNPTITYAAIARKFNFTAPTAKRRVEKLQEAGIYRGNSVQYDPHAIGLTRYVVLSYIPSPDSFPIIEEALRNHPYTYQRSRLYGTKLGIYAQFNYPSKDNYLLESFYSELKDKGIITTYFIYKSTSIRKTLSINLDDLSLSSFEWDFDWHNFLESLKKAHDATVPSVRKNVLAKMKPIDFKILHKLTTNADISQRQIAKELETDTTEIWRRIHFLKENVLTGYFANIDRRFFNITSNKILLLSFENTENLFKCYNVFVDPDKRPPFRFHIEIFIDQDGKKHILLFVSLPQYHEAQLIYSLNYVTEKLKVLNVDTIGYNSIRYQFYPNNFDELSHSWKLTKDYVCLNPLQTTLKKYRK